jgi:cation diffusion facilitator family transporter
MSKPGTASPLELRARAASVALWAAFFLTALKLATAAWSGSVGVLSEGIHSGLDLVSALVASYSIREAGKPADREHPYGHGKIETLSSLLESVLLVVASIIIVSEAVSHFRHPVPVEHTGVAIATIAVSLVVSYFVFRHNAKAGRVTDSSAIQVNALHFLADAVTSAGVLIALAAMHLTGASWIDPIVALLIALYILGVSWSQLKRAIEELTDRRLPLAEVERAREILETFKPRIMEAHELKTRRSGACRHFSFHAIVCGKVSVAESHAVCDDIEARLEAEFPGSSITIHVEPCGHPGSALPSRCFRTASGKCEAGVRK